MFGRSPLRQLSLSLLVLLGLSLPVLGQGEPSPKELVQLREHFAKLLERRETDLKSARQGALQKVQDASRSGGGASSAFADVYRTAQLAGKVGQSAEFSEWQKKNAEWLSDTDFRAAVQLHLQYLALSMERAASDRPEDFLTPARQHLQAVAELQKRLAAGNSPKQAQDILQTGIKNSPFTKAWQLQPFLEFKGSWADSSGQVEQILQQTIRPILREQRSADLPATWDWQIQYETDLLQREQRQHARDQFENVRRPALLFQQAQARAEFGQTARAAADGIKILQTHPAHPDFNSWVEQIGKWLEKVPVETEPEPAEETSTKEAEVGAAETPS
jgi:hypothetical protein